MLPILFATVWATLVGLMIARGFRVVDRWWEFKRWARCPGYEYFGNELPAHFPVDMLADAVFFVHVHNCVCWQLDGIRHLAFDLELPGFSRQRRWMTVVAAEGRIFPDRPWIYAEEATASQGSGWVVLTPRKRSTEKKIWIWKMLDNLPPRDQMLEPDVIFDLWQKVHAVAQSVRPRALVVDPHPARRS